MADLRKAKATLRKKVLLRRDALAEPERSAAEGEILGQILDLPAYRDAQNVLAYASFGSELTTDAFLRHALDDDKVLHLPRVDPGAKRLLFYRVKNLERDLEPGVWGIREPRVDPGIAIDPGIADFVLVPGVAFDRGGWRLGYGGGFYDALISTQLPSGTALVSGAFECQLVEEIPRDEHDAQVKLVITESGRYPADR